MRIIDPTYAFLDGEHAPVIRHDQEIPSEFLSDLSAKRHESSSRRMGEMERVASIPTAVVEKWQREGFDIFASGVTAREIVARLRVEELDAFITTTKSI